MFFSLLMLFVAGVLAVPVITGKGKLLATENIKKDKIPLYKKVLRILYGVMMVVVLLMAFFNFVEKVAYTQTYYYTFTEEYVGKDGLTYGPGKNYTRDEMLEILIPTESSASGSLCAPSEESEPLPYAYVETVNTLQDKYSFLGFVSYQTARVLNFVGLGVSMAVVFSLFFFINRMTDKKEQQKNSRASKRDPVRPSLPKGAFDFSDYKDEVEVTDDRFDYEQDEIPAKPQKKKK